jgi:hypothetical protein
MPQQGDTLATTRSRRDRSRRQTPAHSQDEEDFDLDVSGSDNDRDSIPIRAHHQEAINTVAQVINNPDARKKSKNAAHDVWHYFVKKGIGDDSKAICRVCK